MSILNQKNYIIGGIVITAVVILGYFLMKDQYRQPIEEQVNVEPSKEMINPSPTVIVPTEATTGAQKMQKNTVEYTDKGFDPKSITVKAGTKVTWKNIGDKPMWVASAPHPAHTDLPGFDQLKSTGKDSSYTFTFTKPGSWKYHNHVMASDFGVVMVVEK